MHLKRIIPVAIAAAAIAVPAAASAAPKHEQSPNPDAQCGTGAGSGAFGAFGNHGFYLDEGVLLHDMGQNKPYEPWNGTLGANGYQTGLNNSGVCGNRLP